MNINDVEDVKDLIDSMTKGGFHSIFKKKEKKEYVDYLIRKFPEYKLKDVLAYRASSEKEKGLSFSWSHNPLGAFYSQISMRGASEPYFMNEAIIGEGFDLFNFIEDANKKFPGIILNQKQDEREILASKIKKRDFFCTNNLGNIFYALTVVHGREIKILKRNGALLCYSHYESLSSWEGVKSPKFSRGSDILREICNLEQEAKKSLEFYMFYSINTEKIKITEWVENYHLDFLELNDQEFAFLLKNMPIINNRYFNKREI